MKNHIKVNGKLLQTNKKWSHLKERQKTWIFEVTKEEHSAFVSEHGKLPRKKYKEVIVDKVMEKINEREIWIPYYEAESQINKFIDRQNRKSPLYQPTKKQLDKTSKPRPPLAPFDEFPDDEQERLLKILEADITRYIKQTHKAPPNRIRDNDIKLLLKSFNSKKYHPYGKKMKDSEALLKAYDEQRKRIFDEYTSQGTIPQTLNKIEKNRIADQVIVLQSDRIILRKMNTKDWKEIKVMLSDPEIMQAWGKVFATKREVMDWIIRQLKRYQKELVGYFAAIDKESGQLIGQIGLMWSDIQGKRCLEISYILKKEFWHKGYATEGAKACISYGFELFKIDEIYATIRPDNTAAIAVAERIGMSCKGAYMKRYDGKQIKHLIYVCKNPNINISERPV